MDGSGLERGAPTRLSKTEKSEWRTRRIIYSLKTFFGGGVKIKYSLGMAAYTLIPAFWETEADRFW